MSIADEIEEATTKRGGCTVTQALDKLDDDTRAEFVAELAGDAQGEAIARVLSRYAGVRLAGQTIQRHRKGGCVCGDL